MKQIISITVFALFSLGIRAQQLPLYSQYMVNDYLVNPAVAGINPYFEMKTNVRYQWVGVTDAPRTYVLSVHGPWKDKNMGLGGFVFNDVTGPTRRTGFTGSYAYHVKLNDNMKLGLGLSAGLLQFAVDGGKIIINDYDPVLSTGVQSVLIPDFGFGAQLYAEKWYVGLSAPQLLNNKLQFFDNITSLSRVVTHFYLIGGYKYTINDDYMLEPSAAVKYVYPVDPQFDISLRAVYKKMVWTGLSYRTQDALAFMLGYVYDEQITIAYSYDYPLSNIRKYSTGSHEIMLGVRFGKGMVSSK